MGSLSSQSGNTLGILGHCYVYLSEHKWHIYLQHVNGFFNLYYGLLNISCKHCYLHFSPGLFSKDLFIPFISSLPLAFLFFQSLPILFPLTIIAFKNSIFKKIYYSYSFNLFVCVFISISVFV